MKPSKPALTEDNRAVSYGELADQVASVAHALRRAGVRRGDRVALLAGRGVHTVAAQLGVMACGAAFVPLDPASPTQVNLRILDEAGPTAILSQTAHLPMAQAMGPGDCPVIDIAKAVEASGPNLDAVLSDPACRVGPDDLAYVIYTSGSTGRPKGVMVAHRGVCRLVRGQSYADLGPDLVMLNMAAVGFDASIGEIYSAVLNGGTLAILPDAAPSLDRIEAVIARDRVTCAYITAGLFHIIAEHRPEILAPLAQVFPCGDVLSQTHVHAVRRAVPHLQMINGYGPTENTVFTCCFPIDARWSGGPIPIGLGLAHDHLFVLDDDLNPLPDGARGQLAVGGAGVALGYLGRPDLTDAAFVTLRTPGFAGRVYLTGDLVVRQDDGVVWFHGRVDRQVKINGQRVELDMVEHALRADPAVRDAAVVATTRPDGSRIVVAFVTPVDANVAEIQARLRDTLPAAAVPSRIERRDHFPLSASGKVDRKTLAATLPHADVARCDTTSHQSLRDTIRQTWQDILDRPVTDDTQTFFDLGGTSLQLIAVHSQLQQRLGLHFDIARLFEAPRIRELERALTALAAPSVPSAQSADPFAATRAAMAEARLRKRSAR